MFAELYGSSVSKKKIQVLKNNWDIFTKWGEGIVQSLFRELKRANA
jgi:hypothetical protein